MGRNRNYEKGLQPFAHVYMCMCMCACMHTVKVKTSSFVQTILDWVAVFSLDCFWGVLHPRVVPIYPPTSVSEAAAPPIRIRMMACKADLYSIEQLYTCKYTATD